MYYVSDVAVEMPDELDLSPLRGTGLQPGEEELPEDVPEPPGGYCRFILPQCFTHSFCKLAFS